MTAGISAKMMLSKGILTHLPSIVDKKKDLSFSTL